MIWIFWLGIICLMVYNAAFRKVMLWLTGVSVAFVGLVIAAGEIYQKTH